MYRSKPIKLNAAFATFTCYGAGTTSLRSTSSVITTNRRFYPYSTNTRPPSIWQSIIPKSLRNHPARNRSVGDASRNRGWNPATFFIIIFLIIGSNAIQMISLRNDSKTFGRQIEARIRLLQKTVEQVQQGQEVDVKKVLGTEEPEAEDEWNEVMKELMSASENASAEHSGSSEKTKTLGQCKARASSSDNKQGASVQHVETISTKATDQVGLCVESRFF